MLGNDTYSSALGLGDQKLSDFLQTSDTPTLRTKYYDAVDKGLSSAGQPATPDQANLTWQGIIPALAAAVITKGKSLGFSGGPLNAVLQNEQKRADDQQTLNINAKLKGAGLLGEELQKRETLASTAAERAAQLEETNRHNTETEANTKLQIEGQTQAHADALAAQNGREQDRQDDRSSKQAQAYGTHIMTELKSRRFQDRYEALQSAQSAMSQVEGSGGAVATLPMKEAITRYYLSGGRQAKAIIEGSVPESLQGKATTALNWLTSTNENTVPPEQMKGLRALVDAADIDLSHELKEVSAQFKKRAATEAPALKPDQVKTYTDPSEMGFGGLKHLQDISPQKSYKSPNGNVLTGAQVLQQYGNNPGALSHFTEVQ